VDGLSEFIGIFLHIDRFLLVLAEQYGSYIYLFIFITIFLETGIVITPILPGDSLLFVAGAMAASTGELNIWLLFLIISIAAIIGDSVNYSIGSHAGPRIFSGGEARIFKREYLTKTEEFYDKYGDKAIVLGRFFPIARTFVPFIAGISKMNYAKFVFYNVIGGVLWVLIFLFSGYFFGNIKTVKENFSLAISAIIILSLIPAFYQLKS